MLLAQMLIRTRAAALSLALLSPTVAHALCNGPSFTESLTADQRATLDARAAATPFSNGNFWRAEKEGTELTIIGTIHLPDARLASIIENTAPALSAADLLLVEATQEDQAEMQRYMAENPEITLLPDNATLPELVDAETWATISDALSARGMPPFMAARMQPWFLAMTLSLPPCAAFAMASGEPGLDNLLMTKAQEDGIPTASLEPWQDMLNLLRSGTLEEQIDGIEMALLPPDIQDAMVMSLLDFYFAGETAKGWFLTDFTVDLVPGMDQATFDALMADMEQELLVNRNRAWIPVIEAAAAKHDRIVLAFGAAHLFGEDGVPNLLQQAGWVVTPY